MPGQAGPAILSTTNRPCRRCVRETPPSGILVIFSLWQVESADDFAKEVQKRVLEARADWEAERVSTTQLHVDDLRALEASHLASIEAKVAQLRSKYDFLRPKPQRSCVDEERQVSECYATAANALDCARFVDQYAACARAVTEQLAISIQAAE